MTEQDIETLAAEKRSEREQECAAAIKAILETHRCQMTMTVAVGEQQRPIGEVLGLPVTLRISSK